jgi:tRNA(Ile)-lysidine synthase TilS/MesJ
MKYIRNVLAALRKADRDYSLIDSGDKILVGLSGGKDSLSLLRALSVYGKFAEQEVHRPPGLSRPRLRQCRYRRIEEILRLFGLWIFT